MRNLNLEAAVWNLFTSNDFFEAAAQECEATMDWFGTLAVSRQAANFGRNNQIFDKFKTLAHDFRRGAELARLGDYRSIWDTARCVRGDVRGMLEQPLHSWMTETEYQEFDTVRITRLMTYARQITRALNNAMVGADSFFELDADCPERRDDDDGFPGDRIVEVYNSSAGLFRTTELWNLADPLPQYAIDKSITCQTGDEVPWTGVWYPSNGLEKQSLTFAIKGLRMQPVYRVIKSTEELRNEDYMFPPPETVAVATTWHPVSPSSGQAAATTDLWAKEGESCPKAGIWQPTDPGAAQRTYDEGKTMASLGPVYGLTVWRWIADR